MRGCQAANTNVVTTLAVPGIPRVDGTQTEARRARVQKGKSQTSSALRGQTGAPLEVLQVSAYMEGFGARWRRRLV